MKKKSDKVYRITFQNISEFKDFQKESYQFVSINEGKLRMRVQLQNKEIQGFLNNLSTYRIADFVEFPFTLEDYFMKFYKEDKVFEGVRQ